MQNNTDPKGRKDTKKVCVSSQCALPGAKPLSEFAITNRNRMNEVDGHSELCKECTKRAYRERRAKQMADREGVRDRLINWRERWQLSQKEAAVELGLPYGTYIGYEQEHRGKWMSENRYKYIIERTANVVEEPNSRVIAGQKTPITRKRRVTTARDRKNRKASDQG
jgi:hypothetical protein